MIWVSSRFWVLASNQPELPDYCNRGIGTTLLHMIQSEAAAAGRPAFAPRASAFAKATADKTAGRLLRIRVGRFNPALRLYERLGFRQIDDRGVYLFMELTGRRP